MGVATSIYPEHLQTSNIIQSQIRKQLFVRNLNMNISDKVDHSNNDNSSQKLNEISEYEDSSVETSVETQVIENTFKQPACPTTNNRRRRVNSTVEVPFRNNYCSNPLNPAIATPIKPEVYPDDVIVLSDPLGNILLPPFKQWQIYPGFNRFYCDGRLVTGPDRLVFYLSFGLLNLIFALFFAAVIPYQPLQSMQNTLIPITIVLYLLCALTMLYSALIDPGIIPRPTHQEVEVLVKNNESMVHANGVFPFIRETVNEKVISRRWCNTCLMYKPPRATHCRTCNNCVERFDHHCPFLGNCVGQRNYRSFFIFLVSIVISSVYVALICVVDVVLKCKDAPKIGEVLVNLQVIGSIITGVLAVGSCIPVMVLLHMHIGLVMNDLTTNEDIKRAYGPQNPFDRHNKLKNCFHVFCDPRLPSMIKSRKVVTAETLESLEYSDAVKKSLLRQFGRPLSNVNHVEQHKSEDLSKIIEGDRANSWNIISPGWLPRFHRQEEPNIPENSEESVVIPETSPMGDFFVSLKGDSQHQMNIQEIDATPDSSKGNEIENLSITVDLPLANTMPARSNILVRKSIYMDAGASNSIQHCGGGDFCSAPKNVFFLNLRDVQ